MKKIYITFGGNVFDNSTKKIVERATILGADDLWVYDDLWITKQEFYKQNSWLWEHPHKRGFGWYSWKPYIIIDALSRLNDGDIVLYTDADTYPITDLSPLFNICDKEGAMIFEVTNENNRKWCKRDCYVVMGQDKDEFYDCQACVGRFILFKKGDWRSYQLLLEWMAYTVNKYANTFDKSILGNEIEGFVEHRCEQSVLTLLAHKYKYKIYREACGLGEVSKKDRDLYPQVFVQDNEWNNKTKGNKTAPIVGSIYRNVDAKIIEKINSGDNKFQSSKKQETVSATKVKIKIENFKIISKRYLSKFIPRTIKRLIKKLI